MVYYLQNWQNSNARRNMLKIKKNAKLVFGFIVIDIFTNKNELYRLFE